MTGSGLSSALYAGGVMHQRRDGPSHRFEYPLFMWLLDIDELPVLGRRVSGFGYNRRRPIAFRDQDHFDGTSESVAVQVRRVVEGRGLRWPGGPVRVLTHCRMLGYVFNPVSFWYCYAPDGQLAVIVAEVNNTFGDRHCYVSAADQWGGHPSSPAGDWARWDDKKVFHVSPFFSLDGTYRFAIEPPGPRLRVRLDLRVAGEIKLTAVLALAREELRRSSVAHVLARYPLMTARVIVGIHWEALRLWRKGATYHPRPPYDPGAARQGAA